MNEADFKLHLFNLLEDKDCTGWEINDEPFDPYALLTYRKNLFFSYSTIAVAVWVKEPLSGERYVIHNTAVDLDDSTIHNFFNKEEVSSLVELVANKIDLVKQDISRKRAITAISVYCAILGVNTDNSKETT